MTDDQRTLDRLLQEKREACGRLERLTSYRSTMTDKGITAAARRICEDAKEAVRRFLREHAGSSRPRNFDGPR
jgi:hypothetical protein